MGPPPFRGEIVEHVGMASRTVITIAHRLSTPRNADKIINIKDGVVAEGGYTRVVLLSQ
jgi:ABC-type multidrug transport system fused ATPase/permease subunit